ncbi:monovalent cation/H(+) antiporter subunit G [Gleimia sp. 6138-11-ORH1]|uniref:monovalent cation/H(+) antiporter subunit G n=1 Tax=Gleimia sp. 6138-11-ORH1 TaxID=2973937 RepID=UPI0021671EAA|nr:monovalent cation/H(+) antiporter subunit G [Gleimia sp. 6138-11-ORH1]MCS4484702.1 monovalent cation/H(+) antiporter subunit G [Gleimia sp. 6138-11-ORH1]
MNEVLTYLGAVSLFLGALVLLVAAIGIVIFDDLYARMHAAAKPQWLGVFLIALGMALTQQTWKWFIASVLVVVFQTISAPIGSHILARTASRASER